MVREGAVRLTPAGRTKLQDELTNLTTVKRPQLASLILEANDSGDISGNSEYEAMKEELVLTDARIQDLQFLLERAEIIERPGTDMVRLGSTVTLRSDDGEKETWTLVSHAEADSRAGTISTESPVGEALLGKRKGESAPVKTPGGLIVYTVAKIA